MNKVLMGVIAVVIILLIARWYFSQKNKLTNLAPASEKQTITAYNLANGSQSTNFAYSIWFYIDDWSYRYGEEKIMVVRNRREPCPEISLDATENNLNILVYDFGDTENKCVVNNVPLQKWTNLIVSAYNQTLDIYINGKLVKTQVLDGVPKLDTSTSVEVTPDGGFSGWTSNIEYWDKALNPQEALNIYQSGNGGSVLSKLFKYGLRLQLIDDNEVKGSVEI